MASDDPGPTLRQQLLLRRSAELRQDLAEQVGALKTPLTLVDRAREAWRWLREHPEVVLAGAAGFAVVRPRRAWRWGLRLWWAWRTWQRLRRES